MQAFTVKSNNGLLRVLQTPITVLIPNTQTNIKSNAIWDTGATSSVITKKIISQLGLFPTGMSKVSTANGVVDQHTYIVDIQLPNNVICKDITVTGVSDLSGGCDVLIGMDIINAGDFSITNYNGTTCMSFRFPSSHEIDYVKNPLWKHEPNSNSKLTSGNLGNTSRNAQCSCGSGKKYKQCCGK
jgi:hypothetical protein